MVLLEWSELMSHSLPSSSEKGESDRGEPLSFGRKGWRTRRGMRLRGLPFSGDFLSCSTQTSFRSSVGQQPRSTSPLWQAAKGFCFLPHTYFQTRDLTCKNIECRKRLTSYSWNGPIVLHGVFFPLMSEEEEKKSSQMFYLSLWCRRGSASMWRSDSWYTRALCLNSGAF